MINIESKLKKIFHIVLKIKNSEIDNKLTPDKTKNWDSLNHMNLIIAIEQTFQIKFNSNEIAQLFSYKDILRIIKKKMKK